MKSVRVYILINRESFESFDTAHMEMGLHMSHMEMEITHTKLIRGSKERKKPKTFSKSQPQNQSKSFQFHTDFYEINWKIDANCETMRSYFLRKA